MKIAVPIWEDKISPVFDTALRLLVIETEDNREVSRFMYLIDENGLVQKCHSIRKLCLDTLICGAVSRTFLKMLLESGLNVINEISGPVEDVLNAYLRGDIYQPKFLMPGCGKCCPRLENINKNRKLQGGNTNVEHKY